MKGKEKEEKEGKEIAKDKIIKAGMKLFSRYGYDKSSIRDIAKAANVNIAAISYYFGSKDGLLNVVIKKKKEEIDEKMMAHCQNLKDDFEKLALALFDIYIGVDQNFIKMYMMALFDHKIDFNVIANDKNRFGPPGTAILWESFQKYFSKIGVDLGIEDLIWASRTLGLHMFGLSNILRNYGDEVPEICSKEIADASVKKLMKAVLNELGGKK